MPVHHVQNYVEYLKSKPEDVRRRVALLASAGATMVIALAWFIALASSGALALAPTGAPTEANRELAQAAQAQQESFSNLLGAAAAFKSGFSDGSLNVVESHSSSTLDKPESAPADATVIPF